MSFDARLLQTEDQDALLEHDSKESSGNSVPYNSKIYDNRMTPVSQKTLLCYGVGHFLNDMTAACWFNYLLVFLIQVTKHTPTQAGIIMLSGQVADAIATPLVGVLSDKTRVAFGRRKLWLASGAFIVNISFFFVFSKCYLCSIINEETQWFRVLYWAVFAATFNVGWAAIQVSHMALVPEITDDESERVRLNSARYASGIVATLLVLGISWVAFQKFGISEFAFYIIAGSSLVLGDFFTLVFLLGVTEQLPRIIRESDKENINTEGGIIKRYRSTWYSWFKVPMFYQVGFIYMFSRIAVNISQIFMPFFLEFTLMLENSRSAAIAEVPLVVMLTSFTTTFFLKKVNKYYGRRTTYTVGALFVCVGLIGLYFVPEELWFLVYVIALFLGVGTTTVLVTSISMEADLIGTSVQSGAFVYGALSFTDKLSNGILIQVTSVYSKDSTMVRYIITGIPGIAAILAVLVTFTILEYYRVGSKKKKKERRALLKRYMPDVVDK